MDLLDLPMRTDDQDERMLTGDEGDERSVQEEQDALMEDLFDKFATGSCNGIKIFLRLPDLKEFMRQTRGGLSTRMFIKRCEILETVFNDTMQLQIDMDVRTNKGLTF